MHSSNMGVNSWKEAKIGDYLQVMWHACHHHQQRYAVGVPVLELEVSSRNHNNPAHIAQQQALDWLFDFGF